MTLKVGESYRGVFAYNVAWLGVTKIEMMANGAARISYRVLGSRRIPRFTWWCLVRSNEPASVFVTRLDDAAEMDRKEFEAAATRRTVRTVQEIEVRYK